MSKWIFKDYVDIEDLVFRSLDDKDLLPPTNDPDVLEYFSNGDRMSVNVKTRELYWEPSIPGVLTTSKLSLRMHQWVGKSLLRHIEDEPT